MATSKVEKKKKIFRPGLGNDIKKDFHRNYILYIMILPVLAYYIVFNYVPMYGVLIAFQKYVPAKGILGSQWVSFDNFASFFSNGKKFYELMRNTLSISVANLVLGFPAPIIFALLINEVKNKYFSKFVKTATYLPHFISLVVVCGMIKTFTSGSGIITQFFALFGAEKKSMLSNANLFMPIYVLSDIWQNIGWDSIIYIAALTGINQELYEACSIDGGGKWRQTFHVTLPGILPTIVIMLILRIGGILSVGHEKVILMASDGILSKAEVIGSYVYRRGIKQAGGNGFSFATAVGLFNSVVNIIFLISANKISAKLTDSSLW